MKSFPWIGAASAGLMLFCPLKGSAAGEGSVVLDEEGVKNLGIETIVTEEGPFTETAFALGHIESIPARSGSVSSRISGRLSELTVTAGDLVGAGQVVAKVESRQPGDPPPTVPLVAPLKGTVMKIEVHLGDPVEPDKALLTVTDLSAIYAIASVPEYQAGALKPGTKATIRVAALGGKSFEGSLLRFGTEADREAGTIDAVFALPNDDLSLRPGMRAEFDIALSVRENVLTVPKESVQGNPASRHVWVKDITVPNAFVKAPVRTGRTSGDRIEILGGIFPGDEVVTRGSYSLGFAGGGSGLSLKEALDAAHGHEHNEDGSEMTPEQAAAKKAAHPAASHDHDHGDRPSGLALREMIFMASTAILLVLLALQVLAQRESVENP